MYDYDAHAQVSSPANVQVATETVPDLQDDCESDILRSRKLMMTPQLMKLVNRTITLP